MKDSDVSLRADVLAKILVMQSMLREMPEEKSIFGFLCRGLEDVPGVRKAWHSETLTEPLPGVSSFPLQLGMVSFGELVIEIADETAFAPYSPYMSNLCFMVAVILEQRRLAQLKEDNLHKLEERVRLRTRELSNQVFEREMAEQHAQEERLRAERYLELAEAMIVELDVHGRVVLINKRCCDVLGYESCEIAGQNWFDLVISRDERAEVERVFAMLLAGQYEMAEYADNKVLCKDGSHRHIAWHNTPRKNNDGKIIGTLSSGSDFTERMHAQLELAAEKERLAVTLRSIGDGVITTDTRGFVTIMNRVAEELTGWSAKEATGQPLATVFPLLDEQTGKPCEDPVARVLSTGGIVELVDHTILVARDGSELAIADSGAPIRDSDSNIIGVVIVFRDMSERQKLMAQLQRTDKLDSLGILAGGIAHDFNNLLGGVFGYLEMARKRCASDSVVARNLDKALTVYERAKGLTQQLLTFAKGGEPVRQVGSIAALARNSVSFVLSGSRVTCEYQLDALWLCDFDENQIGQVIDNLTINALQAMPYGGTITVRGENITITRDSVTLRPGRYVRLSIHDTGVGIPHEMQSRVFDPFFTTKDTGNGLGLATCYSILQKHGGCIEVDSKVGKGSTFTIYLPASEEVVPEKAEQEQVRHRGAGRILVLDDEDFIREMLAELLGFVGYESIAVATGDEAVGLCRESMDTGPPFVGMLLDLTIPGGRGGRDIIAELRQLCPDTPIFASSGYSDSPVIAKPADYGFTDSIRKPYRLDELETLLHKYL